MPPISGHVSTLSVYAAEAPQTNGIGSEGRGLVLHYGSQLSDHVSRGSDVSPCHLEPRGYQSAVRFRDRPARVSKAVNVALRECHGLGHGCRFMCWSGRSSSPTKAQVSVGPMKRTIVTARGLPLPDFLC